MIIRNNEEEKEYENLTEDSQQNYDYISLHDNKISHENIIDMLVGIRDNPVFKDE